MQQPAPTPPLVMSTSDGKPPWHPLLLFCYRTSSDFLKLADRCRTLNLKSLSYYRQYRKGGGDKTQQQLVGCDWWRPTDRFTERPQFSCVW